MTATFVDDESARHNEGYFRLAASFPLDMMRMSEEKRADVEYVEACKRLMVKALTSGDGEFLRDVKTVMDVVSDLSHRGGMVDPARSGVENA